MKHEAKKAEPVVAPKPEAPKPEAPSAEAPTTVAALPEGATLADVIAKVNELVARGNAKRDRGPTSKREMTEDDARRVVLGDLKDATHAKAAEVLLLSYGQVYSARGGFTFKKVYQEWHRANPNRAIAGPKA